MSSDSAHSGWEAGGSEDRQWLRWWLVEVDREEEEEDKEEQLKKKREEEYGPDPERESPWC